MKLYRIHNWESLFENNRSRKIKDLAWVAIPNRHDGENYSAIVLHPRGAEIFAAWVLMVQVASRCQPRGSLVRDNGNPHTSASLSVKTRAPQKWFDLAFEYLENETDWLDVQDVASDCHRCDVDGAHACQSGDEEQKERTEQKEQKESAAELPLPLATVSAEQIYEVYPRKVAKTDALKSIAKALKKIDGEKLLKVVGRFALAWEGRDKHYCPHPTTWFNQERYNDDPETWGPSKTGIGSVTPRTHAEILSEVIE